MRFPISQPYQRSTFFVLLLTTAAMVGWGVVQHPNATIFIVTIASLSALGLLWLARNSRSHALIGGFLFLTILRPLPGLWEALVVGRIVDLVWLLLALLIIYQITGGGKRLLQIWRGSIWLLLMPVAVLISISAAILVVQQPVITRDFFELYRGPYYFLIILVVTQVTWSDKQLSKFLFKPLVVALWVSFAISILQSPLAPSREIIEYLYTPKGAKDIFVAISSASAGETFKLRTSGTFGNPNWYGVALAMVIPFLLAGWSIIGNRRLRLATLATAITALIFLGVTGSRTAIAAGILATLVYFLIALWDGCRTRGPSKTGYRGGIP